jgi:hypothetical protein
MMLASAVMLTWNIGILSYVHQVPARVFLVPFVKGLSLAVPLVLAALWATTGREPYGWVGLLAEMGGWFTVYSVGWFILAGRTEQREWMKLLTRFRAAKSG